MVGLFSSLWKASGLNNLWPYIIVGLIVMASLVLAYTQGRSAGSASASTKRLQDSLNQYKKEAQLRAEIESDRTGRARDQLRKRWSQR